MLDYFKSKLLKGWFSSLSSWASLLGLLFAVFSDLGVFEKIGLCLFILFINFFFIIVRNSYLEYMSLGRVVENLSAIHSPIVKMEEDPSEQGVKHFLVKGCNLQAGQLAVLRLETENNESGSMKFALGLLHVMSINEAGEAQCELISRKIAGAAGIVEDPSRLSQLKASSVVRVDDLRGMEYLREV